MKRGERGIMIFAPMLGRKRQNVTDAKTTAGETAEKGDVQLVGFRAVYVFDVAQTEGKELPELEPQAVKGEVGDKLSKLVAFTADRGIKLEYSEQIAPAQGLSCGGLIKLLPGMEPAEELSTLVHELAHEMLHKRERRALTTKTVRETEAEAIAFVVCNALELETGNASRDYIQLYHGNAELLQESLEAVQNTAAVILGAISPQAVLGSGGTALQSRTMGTSDAYEVWIGKVQQALRSINMPMDDWQQLWPFDFQGEYQAGTKADETAMKANRFWWHEQNRSLKQDCPLTSNCWLPRGHQGSCQPVNPNPHGAS